MLFYSLGAVSGFRLNSARSTSRAMSRLFTAIAPSPVVTRYVCLCNRNTFITLI